MRTLGKILAMGVGIVLAYELTRFVIDTKRNLAAGTRRRTDKDNETWKGKRGKRGL